MKVIPTEIEGVVIIEPRIFGDDRGYFFESYSQQQFDQQVRPIRFVQGLSGGSIFRKGLQPNRNWCVSYGDVCWMSQSISGVARLPSGATWLWS